MFPLHVILHPTDFSPSSEQAFHLACSLARDHGARLIALHVLERPLIIQSGVMTPPPPPAPLPDEREALLERLRRLQPSAPGVRVECRVEEGDPTTAILQVAQEAACDLIVLGTHGRTGLRRLLLGSVAEQVVRKAPCPVLTVKVPHGPTPSN
jgi:nucleotide-binding universal stress UspA family protein